MWTYSTLFFDLEVISTIDAEDAYQQALDKLGPVPDVDDKQPPANWKDPAKIEAWHEKRAAVFREEQLKHSLDLDAEAQKIRNGGALTWNQSQICLFSWAVNDGPVITMPVRGDEADAIETFGRVICDHSPDIVTAFNGTGYDFPMMRYRALQHGLGWVADYFTELHFGVSRQLKYYANGPALVDPRAHGLTPGKWGIGGTASLDACAEFFGIDRSANPGSGSMVQTWYDSGDFASIIAHGEDDIRVFRELWKRVTPWATGE